MKKLTETLIEYGNKLRGAEVYFRDDWGCYYFSLLGKSFGMMTEERITLKGDPNNNILLREKYHDITEGYYTNKKHWNTISMNTKELTIDEMKKLIRESYNLVLKGLTKKEQLIIDEMRSEED